MKYIKQYENNVSFLKYKVNDYVFLKINTIKIHNSEFGYQDDVPESPLAKIVNINLSKANNYFYEVLPAIPTKNIDILNLDDTLLVQESEILRKLKKSEIKEYNIALTANKFNL